MTTDRRRWTLYSDYIHGPFIPEDEPVEVMPVSEHEERMLMQAAEDQVELLSSESGRRWGVSVDRIGGVEEVVVTELEPDSAANRGTER
jgi:chemotaxis protein histidine kinase CheA